MKYAIGVDVHRKFIQVCLMEADGTEVMTERRDLRDPASIVAFFESVPAETEVAMEGSFGWMWLANLLQTMEVPVHLADAKRVRLIAESRLSTDTVDARTLAHLLRTHFLPEAYLAPLWLQRQRMLLRHRQGLLKARTTVKNRVHALLVRYNLHPTASDIFGQAGMAWLRALALPSPGDAMLADHLAHLTFLKEQIRDVEGRLQAEVGPDPRVGWLRSLPGVGRLTAYFILAEIGQIGRFRRPAKLVSYCGLCPSTDQSAGRVRHGRTAGSGRRLLKWALVEAAHTAVRRDPYFAGTFHRLARPKGKGKAYVAVARKMAQVIWYLLTEERPYHPQHNPSRVGSFAAMRVRA
jgi:transposase